MNETIVVENGQAAVATTSVSGTLSPASSATDTIAIVDTPSGKQAALKVYNLNSGGSGGGEAGGDYLPLSGGTLTGDVEFAQPETGTSTFRVSFYSKENQRYRQYRLGSSGSGSYRGFAVSVLGKESASGSYSTRARYAFTENEFTSYDNDVSLGCSDFKWISVYATKLNNGADLAIPTEGGTLARIEDIDAAVGNISTALTAILGE